MVVEHDIIQVGSLKKRLIYAKIALSSDAVGQKRPWVGWPSFTNPNLNEECQERHGRGFVWLLSAPKTNQDDCLFYVLLSAMSEVPLFGVL